MCCLIYILFITDINNINNALSKRSKLSTSEHQITSRQGKETLVVFQRVI